jgi:hypothetical protein
MISRSQMNRQLYQIGGLSSLYGSNTGGQKPIYPRISDIESSLSGAEQRIGDPSFNSFGGTNDGGFGSPMGGVYSGSMGGELPNEQPGLPPIQQITNPNLQNLINQGPLQIPSTLINPVRDGVDTSQLGSPRSGGMGSAINFGQLSSLFGGVGDPRLGAPDVPNSLQQIMRGGAANGGLMNRQLYQFGTDPRSTNGVGSLQPQFVTGPGSPEQLYEMDRARQAARRALQKLSTDPVSIIRDLYNTDVESYRRVLGKLNEFDPRQARQIQQAVEESQDVPEYYDPRLQILDPEQMQRRNAKSFYANERYENGWWYYERSERKLWYRKFF